MGKLKAILWTGLLLVLLNVALPHEDEFGEANGFHFFHTGKLTFPVWTYWAEIIEHFVVVVVISIGLFFLYLNYLKLKTENKGTGLVLWGFVVILLAELLTLLHHFLIFPLGIFNAVFNHGLLLFGILLLTIGAYNFILTEKHSTIRTKSGGEQDV